MSLPKKEVRLYLETDTHAVLSAISRLNNRDLAIEAAILLERTLMGEVHAARLLAGRAAQFGRTRTPPEKLGSPKKDAAQSRKV